MPTYRFHRDPFPPQLDTYVHRLERERDELRAEVERLQAAVTELGVAHIQAQTALAACEQGGNCPCPCHQAAFDHA